MTTDQGMINGSVVIAERRFVIFGQSEPKLWARIAQPRKIQDHRFRCWYSIEVEGTTEVREARDVDSLQALQGALKMLTADVEMHRDEDFGGRLTWEMMESPGALGLPDDRV